MEISNLDPNRKLDFKTFAGKQLSFERDNATLRDNFGNRYRGIDFGLSSLPEFRAEDESIYPGKMIKDHLVFEAPIATAAHLDLEIPAVNVGQTGFFRFRIPAQAIQRTQSRLAAANEKELAVLKTEAGFPSIAGVWQEGPEENQTRVVITQNDDKFTAACTYQDKEHGQISWRMTGTISKDGEIKGTLVHTRAPRGWLHQTRTGNLSATGGTITGHATFRGGGQDFEWKRLDK